VILLRCSSSSAAGLSCRVCDRAGRRPCFEFNLASVRVGYSLSFLSPGVFFCTSCVAMLRRVYHSTRSPRAFGSAARLHRVWFVLRISRRSPFRCPSLQSWGHTLSLYLESDGRSFETLVPHLCSLARASCQAVDVGEGRIDSVARFRPTPVWKVCSIGVLVMEITSKRWRYKKSPQGEGVWAVQSLDLRSAAGRTY
jgi:hypothetical protein